MSASEYIQNTLSFTRLFSMKTPFSVLDTLGKRKHVKQLLQRARTLQAQVQRTKARLAQVQQQSTMAVEEELSEDLVAIMAEADEGMQKLPEGSFKKMFWKQQVQKCNHYKYFTTMHATPDQLTTHADNLHVV